MQGTFLTDQCWRCHHRRSFSQYAQVPNEQTCSLQVPEIHLLSLYFLKDFSKILNYLDNSYLKKLFGEIALNVIKEGCYYGYLIPSEEGVVI